LQFNTITKDKVIEKKNHRKKYKNSIDAKFIVSYNIQTSQSSSLYPCGIHPNIFA
jgi:hypothetical protein